MVDAALFVSVFLEASGVVFQSGVIFSDPGWRRQQQRRRSRSATLNLTWTDEREVSAVIGLARQRSGDPAVGAGFPPTAGSHLVLKPFSRLDAGKKSSN